MNQLLVSVNGWLMFESINYDVLILYEREWKMMTENYVHGWFLHYLNPGFRKVNLIPSAL